MQIYTFSESASSTSPLLYYKGDQLIRAGYPFFLPSLEERFVAFPVLAVRIGRLGKEVAERFAHRYIDGIGVGVDIVAPDRLATCRAGGLPWESAVAFGEAAAAAFTEKNCSEELADNYVLHFALERKALHGEIVVSGASIRRAVAAYSAPRMIKQGDVLLLPPSVPFESSLLREENRLGVEDRIPSNFSERETSTAITIPLEIGCKLLLGFSSLPFTPLLSLRIC